MHPDLKIYFSASVLGLWSHTKIKEQTAIFKRNINEDRKKLTATVFSEDEKTTTVNAVERRKK